MSNSVRKIISSLMRLKGKTIKDLADECGLAEQTVNNKLTRGTNKINDLIKYAQCLGVDIGFKDGDNFYSFIEDENKKHD